MDFTKEELMYIRALLDFAVDAGFIDSEEEYTMCTHIQEKITKASDEECGTSK